MPVTLIIKLNTPPTIREDESLDWRSALKITAEEIQLLNTYSGTENFPRPITSHPDADVVENFLGMGNTPPSNDGMTTVVVGEYDYIDLSRLPAMPQTFTFIIGVPEQAGKISV
jgi:hypothetical protein